MVDLKALYRQSPVAVQSLMVTAFGIHERRLRYGGRYKAFLDELSRGQWWSAEQLEAEQTSRLRALLRMASTRVPYYRDLFRDAGLSWNDIRSSADLAALPFLDKETVRSQPQRFVPERLSERLIASTTGGTTGTPLRYVVTPSALQYSYATYEARFRNWAGVRFGERMASVNGQVIVPIEQQAPPFWRRNLAFNQLYLSAYHMKDAHLGHYVDRLRRFDPVVVVGYVSSIHLLARYVLDKGLVGAVRPRAVLVSSETLFPWLRSEIETAFGARVFDGYGLAEMTAFISQCPEGSMHVSPEYGVVELVGEHGAEELVTTGLANWGMPLLRYRTGDRSTRGDGQCPCGRALPTVGAIHGRVDDRVVTPDGATVGPAPLSLAFQGCRGVREAQVVQDSVEEATVLLVVTPEFDEGEHSRLRAELADRLGHAIRLRFELVPELPRTPAGKRRLIVSSIAHGD